MSMSDPLADMCTRIRNAVPLNARHKRALGEKFITVIRATVKGNVAVAALQAGGHLLFHILAELGSVIVGLMAVTVALLSRRFTRNHFVVFINGFTVNFLHNISRNISSRLKVNITNRTITKRPKLFKYF